MNGIDLFKEYQLERHGSHVHYDESKLGFISYSFHRRNVDECFIDDFFILDDRRELKRAMDLVRFVEKEAKNRGCKVLTAAVNVTKPDADRILRAHLWFKLKPFHVEAPFIYSCKELI